MTNIYVAKPVLYWTRILIYMKQGMSINQYFKLYPHIRNVALKRINEALSHTLLTPEILYK